MSIKNWMSWEGGVDLAACTVAGLSMPNVILHVARVVHTPAGSGPAGMVLWQPDPKGAPVVAGFIAADVKHAGYFGSHIFAGTPFENAPALVGKIAIDSSVTGQVSSRIEVGGIVFETTLSDLGAAEVIHRGAGSPLPFVQQGVEAAARKAALKVNGVAVALILPPVGLSGGAAAVSSPCGLYAR